MNSNSQETLLRIEQNDDQLITMGISGALLGGRFTSSDASDYSRLGAAIGNNTHLEELRVFLGANQALDIANTEFFDGLKRNSSINDLTLDCNQQTLIGGVGHEILKSYQKINNNLTCICIFRVVLDNGGGDAIADTLRWCRNLETINLGWNNITDEQLLPMIDAIKVGCNTSLEELILCRNRIGNAGCHALATLLADTNCNLKHLNLDSNQIGNESAIAIANSLASNTNLESLDLEENQFDQSVVGIFCTVLCNTSSVNDAYRSNHTLHTLILSDEQQGQHANHLATLRRLNIGRNKSHVAIRKILKYHPDIDMGPLFEWDAEGEQTLKALPHVVAWFERAEEAVAEKDNSDSDDDSSISDDDGDEKERLDVGKRMLSAIFRFAKSMPLLFEPISRMEVDGSRKRKRAVT